MILWMLGCSEPRLDTGYWRLSYNSPSIESFSVECDNAQWDITVNTDYWTGNGLLWISDGMRYEKHTLYSVGADPTGLEDRLRLRLVVTSDWRDAEANRSSGFTCSENSELGFFSAIRHPQTLAVADCAEYVDTETFVDLPTLALWDTVPLPTCPN